MTRIFSINILYVSVVLIEQLSCEAKLFFVSQYLAIVVFNEPLSQNNQFSDVGSLGLNLTEHIELSRSVISINLTDMKNILM